jgi:ubiquinol-cytochrome c reductase iron-sulfur subunit
MSEPWPPSEPRSSGEREDAASERDEPKGPQRVVGTPSPTPSAVDTQTPEALSSAEAENRFDPEDPAHAKRAERLVAALFILAFVAGCGFLAAYVGLEIGPNIPAGANDVVAVLRSNLALGTSLAVALLALGAGSMVWVRHLTPDIEIEEERHDLPSSKADRREFQRTFAEGAAMTQVTKRPLLRRTLLLATAPLALAPLFLLRDLGPLPGTALRHTVWRKGLRAVVYGTNRPLRPSDLSEPGSMITVIPEGYGEDQDALAQAGVILIKFEPGQLQVPTVYNGDTLLYTQNWTVDNSIVAYSKICTHLGCPVALYEQTTHHILCPCHQSTFDAAHGAQVVFGPAARPLPQLPLGTNTDGYLVALSDFTQPVGPSFWERG